LETSVSEQLPLKNRKMWSILQDLFDNQPGCRTSLMTYFLMDLVLSLTVIVFDPRRTSCCRNNSYPFDMRCSIRAFAGRTRTCRFVIACYGAEQSRGGHHACQGGGRLVFLMNERVQEPGWLRVLQNERLKKSEPFWLSGRRPETSLIAGAKFRWQGVRLFYGKAPAPGMEAEILLPSGDGKRLERIARSPALPGRRPILRTESFALAVF
jgi:hypothetical protein